MNLPLTKLRSPSAQEPMAAAAHGGAAGHGAAPGDAASPTVVQIPAGAPPRDVTARVLRAHAALLGQTGLAAAATAFANELATTFALDVVSVGMLDHAQIEVVAQSSGAEVDTRAGPGRALAMAMEEAVEQAVVVTYPARQSERPRIVVAHAALARATGGAVCTLPLVSGGRIIGALTVATHDRPPGADDLTALGHIAGLAGPVLALHREANRAWWTRLVEAGRRRSVGRSVTAAVLAGIVGLGITPVDYRVTAPARIEGEVERAVAAPFDGFIEQSHVRPGDHVRAGDVLANLTDRDLELEQRRWQGELNQHENALGAALARGDRAEFAIGRARADEARARLELVEHEIARARLTAPIDGIVIKGDLSQSAGVPVQRGETLLTIAPADRFRIMIDVDERDIGAIDVGQHGELSLAAMPLETSQLRVLRVTPIAVSRDGRNAFEVEAALTSPRTDLRPGLAGVAKIAAGTRTLGWMATHRAVDWLRLKLWSWGL